MASYWPVVPHTRGATKQQQEIVMCMPQMRFETQKPVTFDCCIACGRQIPSVFQLKNPGTEICDYCAAVVVGVDLDEEER